MPYSILFHAMYPDNGRCGETSVRPGIDVRQMQRFMETASEIMCIVDEEFMHNTLATRTE